MHCLLEIVARDKFECLGLLGEFFLVISLSLEIFDKGHRLNRQVMLETPLCYKRSLVRMLSSQHRLEVEYMRYFKGGTQVIREERWCQYCLDRHFVRVH